MVVTLPDQQTQVDTSHTPTATSGDPFVQQLAGLHQHVEVVAGHHLPLLEQPKQAERLLRETYQYFTQEAKQALSVTYAGEWLLDNYYIVQHTIQQIQENMPRRYYDELPKLQAQPFQAVALAGYPRVYAIARALIQQAANRLELEKIETFIAAYQQITPLTMGELWALPLMLNIGILENLLQTVTRIAKLTTPPAFFLAVPAVPVDETIVANCIISLRMLVVQDWPLYFEVVSRVENILRGDPMDAYARMDFDTRNRYRTVIEELAAPSGQAEEFVAATVISLSREVYDLHPDDRRAHIGYYLIDQGRSALEARLNYHAPLRLRLHRWAFERHSLMLYLGSTLTLTILLLLLIAGYAVAVGSTPAQVGFAVLLALIPTTAVSVALLNWALSHLTSPRVLPKMDFSKGVPAEYITVIVIPALLTDEAEIDSLTQQLEQHFLRNIDRMLRFVLLADYPDAPQEDLSGEEALSELAKSRIQALNDKYSVQHGRPFYFFLRRRQWNPAENVWMGWERKRGKLAEFNRWLIDPNVLTSYIVQFGDLAQLRNVRYVVTLDADTVLPRDSARRLIATLAHPLNRATFDQDVVSAGYTILQPRVEVLPTAANRSWFARLFAGDTALDLYTLAVSDIYQDLFGEGIYVGKGIYDVAAFERSLAGRIPENTLLSHDLFEGLHGRAALVTDVVVFEDYPPHYLAQTRRLHRWVRGDWQLLPWLLPRVPHTEGHRVPNRLSIIDVWKIFDNLRRSLVAPFSLLLMVAGWLWLPGSAWVWTIIALLSSVVPLLTVALNTVMQARKDPNWVAARHQLTAEMLRWLLAIVFLPYEALLSLDAIVVTLIRLRQRRRLLQWVTAAHTARLFGGKEATQALWQEMLTALLLAIGVGFLILVLKPVNFLAAVPLLIAWLAAPPIADRISRPILPTPANLTDSQIWELRTLARRTWSYFEEFVGPNDHWLPPDHFQQSPRGIVAHQTSPTNIGLLLLSTLAAYDFGYTGLLDLTLRLRSTFDSLEKLERYRGHFLNWYDTQTMKPLGTPYVSTVDSGNLAGCLLALKQGLLGLHHVPISRKQRWEGLLDILAVFRELLGNIKQPEARKQSEALRDELMAIEQQIHALKNEPQARAKLVASLIEDRWSKFSQALTGFIDATYQMLDAAELNTIRIYSDRAFYQLQSTERDVDILLPWLPLLNQPPALFTTSTGSLLEAWENFLEVLPAMPVLGEITDVYKTAQTRLGKLQSELARLTPDEATRQARLWSDQLAEALNSAKYSAEALLIGIDEISRQAETYFEAMQFGFLFDNYRQVFHIGYNVTTETLDNSYYDLLASESRLASFIAIAKGDVPQKHWLNLGRPLTHVNGTLALLSWSGTMFEYLMPGLLMRTYPGTLLDESTRTAVKHQIAYSKQKGLPWGISESGYYAFDGNQNYQYRAFGVPHLAFKRGLAADSVITPYASLLALAIQPDAVVHNLQQFASLKAIGPHGLYEAIDYTDSRVPLDQKYGLVEEYMAHHQGMVMLVLANYLHQNTFVERFHSEPLVQSAELLLQEQIPVNADIQYPSPEEVNQARLEQAQLITTPWYTSPDAAMPQVHFLSNGRYGVLITSAGGGYSQWGELALTRWRADTTLDAWGTWVYIQDRDNGRLWSATYQPSGQTPEQQSVLFSPSKAEFHRRDGDISTYLEMVVPPDDDLEIRRLAFTNHSDQVRNLVLTSYGEIILTQQESDARHPAFNKLFIESEFLPNLNALLFRRRPRSTNERPIYLVHLLVMESQPVSSIRYETDRASFLGRGQTSRIPAALADGQLSNTTGASLDPIMALGHNIELEPHSTAQIAFITLAADTRQKALELASAYQHWSVIERAFDQARYQGELELHRLSIDTTEIERIQRLLAALLYPHPNLRAAPSILAANNKAQPGLWSFGISGDYPILLVRISDETELGLVRDLLQAHIYWRNRQVPITLVIFNQRDTGYNQELYNQVYRLIVRMSSEMWINRHAGIFILRADQIAEADRVLLQTAARVVLDGKQGSLAEQVARSNQAPVYLPAFVPVLSGVSSAEVTPPVERPTDLQFDNSFGGFSADGREYVMYLEPGCWTPSPWINVIANPDFGFIVSEAGSGFTWAGNSSENRLTPWHNDPVSDLPSEAIYLRDEETAAVWSPTPLPTRESAPYLVRHGAGYSIFEHHSHGLKQRLRLLAAIDAPVKIVQLRLENLWDRPRRITITYYVEWLLGTSKDITQQYVISEFDGNSHTLTARNPYSIEFGERVAFVTANKALHGLTADRTEFLGTHGTLAFPAALSRIGLSGTVQTGRDPCAVLQLHVDLPRGGVEEIHFVLGQAESQDKALQLARQYQLAEAAETAWHAVNEFWENTLTTITIQTPDVAMNLLTRWLLYQTLACRIWGRSALYQSSGAFGFRDQLQDVLALIHARPDVTRQHILTAARYQFEAGDVLHWWHPPSGRGVRTRFSDDLLWLPYVVAQYITATGDDAILDEQIPFLRGEPLRPDEEERYSLYEPTTATYSLYEHCCRALNKGITSGEHDLPLMGTGDWNDGMNRVGAKGRGESVWLGWFLYSALKAFVPFCEAKSDQTNSDQYHRRMTSLQQALELNAWDGNWYLRAFYDDGTPLGSVQNQECRIDSIAQSWSVLSGAAAPERAQQAMNAVREQLITDDLILLFTPPFDRTNRDPGYIKGYRPGVRENGGQYTHASLWTVWAFAELGQGDQAEALFRLLNPIYHSDQPEKAARYRVEPYVIAADVYSVPPYVGRGGWTWYSGSAGWMYRLSVEALLGLHRTGQSLRIDPCIPQHWPGFDLTYRWGKTVYHIRVDNSAHVCRGIRRLAVDGESQSCTKFALQDDGQEHHVEVQMGLSG